VGEWKWVTEAADNGKLRPLCGRACALGAAVCLRLPSRCAAVLSGMHPQLEAIATEFLEALDRLHRLQASVPASAWSERPAPERWSVAECVAHLNLAGAAYLPLLRQGVAEARAVGQPAPERYRRDLAGWLLWRTMGPPARVRTRTISSFVPESSRPAADLVAEFERLQDAQMAELRAADGLPLQRVRVASPFNAKVHYNLFACFGILARHQHRHLWQAEQAGVRGER
jgi:hypothetical protein